MRPSIYRGKTTNNLSRAIHFRSYYNTFRLQVHPVKKLNFGISANNNIIETEPSKYHSLTFVDASCSYIISKRIELTGKVTNLFNQTKYIEGYYSGINYFYYECPLRGIEGLFSISVNFWVLIFWKDNQAELSRNDGHIGIGKGYLDAYLWENYLPEKHWFHWLQTFFLQR